MMLIYLVRHGIAEDPSLAESDASRRLTREGIERTTRIARVFRREVDELDGIYHSVYRRAQETAELFAREFPGAELRAVAGLTPQSPPREALELIRSFEGDGARMLVGHEPHLSALASLMLCGEERPVVEFRKAGIAALECLGSVHRCRLLYLLAPRWML